MNLCQCPIKRALHLQVILWLKKGHGQKEHAAQEDQKTKQS